MLLALGVLTMLAGLCSLVCDDGHPALICFPSATISVFLAIWLLSALFQSHAVHTAGQVVVAKGLSTGSLLFVLSAALTLFAALWTICPHTSRPERLRGRRFLLTKKPGGRF